MPCETGSGAEGVSFNCTPRWWRAAIPTRRGLAGPTDNSCLAAKRRCRIAAGDSGPFPIRLPGMSVAARFCPSCLSTEHPATAHRCAACGMALLAMLDANGALSRDFLAARKSCCDNGCRNCPYPSPPQGPSDLARAPKTCEKCGRNFVCEKGDCWCSTLVLSDASLRLLQATYSDCLCVDCLTAYTAARSALAPSQPRSRKPS